MPSPLVSKSKKVSWNSANWSSENPDLPDMLKMIDNFDMGCITKYAVDVPEDRGCSFFKGDVKCVIDS